MIIIKMIIKNLLSIEVKIQLLLQDKIKKKIK